MIKSEQHNAIVLLHSARNRPCSKVYYLEDGRPKVQGYGKETHWNAEVLAFDNVYELGDVITRSAQHNCIAVVGSLIDESQRNNIKRQKYGSEASLQAAERSWVALDIDGENVEGRNLQDRLEAVVAKLPPAFHNVTYFYQLTPSYLLDKNPNNMRCRFWMMLDEPVHTEVLRQYFKTIPEVDECIFTCIQPIYITPPKFRELSDPVGPKRRMGVVEHDRDRVDTSMIDFEAATQAFEAHKGAAQIGRLNVPPDEKQIQEAIDRIKTQETVGSRHNWMVGVVCELYGLGADPKEIVDVCEDCFSRTGRVSEPNEIGRALQYAARQAALGKLVTSNVPTAMLLSDDEKGVSSGDQMKVNEWWGLEEESEDQIPDILRGDDDYADARSFVRIMFGDHGYVRWGGTDYFWTGGHWQAMSEEGLESRVANLAGGFFTTARVSQVSKAVRRRYLREDLDLPCWLDKHNHRAEDQGYAINCANGLVYIEDAMLDPPSALVPPTSRYFSTGVLPFDYDGEAECPLFMKCLDDWFPGDPETQRELQKMFGYLLVPDNKYQKYFILQGRGRAGKGVITSLLGMLLGPQNTTTLSLTGLGNPHGTASLVGKPVCFIHEANAQNRRDVSQDTVDRLKSITGGDVVDINPKNKPIFHAALPTRFVMSCNQVPRFPDPSGAMLTRMHIFSFKHSFAGKEDFHLINKLKKELPGILNWALRGLSMLYYEDERFLSMSASEDLRHDISRESAPVRAFSEDCLLPMKWSRAVPIRIDDIYEAYRGWCRDQGFEHVKVKQTFVRELKSFHPSCIWKSSRGQGRPATVTGVTLSDTGRSLTPSQMDEGFTD